jgi:hypothetical protein
MLAVQHIIDLTELLREGVSNIAVCPYSSQTRATDTPDFNFSVNNGIGFVLKFVIFLVNGVLIIKIATGNKSITARHNFNLR